MRDDGLLPRVSKGRPQHGPDTRTIVAVADAEVCKVVT